MHNLLHNFEKGLFAKQIAKGMCIVLNKSFLFKENKYIPYLKNLQLFVPIIDLKVFHQVEMKNKSGKRKGTE